MDFMESSRVRVRIIISSFFKTEPAQSSDFTAWWLTLVIGTKLYCNCCDDSSVTIVVKILLPLSLLGCTVGLHVSFSHWLFILKLPLGSFLISPVLFFNFGVPDGSFLGHLTFFTFFYLMNLLVTYLLRTLKFLTPASMSVLKFRLVFLFTSLRFPLVPQMQQV